MQQLDWTATLSAMRNSLPRAQYLSWIEPLEFIQSDETSVRLGVPSRFHEEMLKSQLRQQLTDVIKKQVGRSVQLEFEVLVQKENLEASESTPTAVISIDPPQPARPTLRVIDGDLAQHPDPDEMPVERKVFRPNYPKFATPFFQVESNQVAYQAAELFCDFTNPTVSSLLIVGGVGMGKTHLLSEVGNQIHQKDPAIKVRYISTEAFTAEMIQSFKDNTNHEFKRKYREETDVLLFDDIHHLSNKEKTQEQVLHIFNELTTAGKRILFTSNIPPHLLPAFSPPLKSRLCSLMNAEIQIPTYEDKASILASICESNRMLVDGQVIRTLADRDSESLRELIGSMLRLHLQAKLGNRALDQDFLAKHGIGYQPTHQKPRASLNDVLSLVELNFGVSRKDLVGPSRKSTISWARQVGMYLSRHCTLLPLQAIGEFYGRDHATVIHAYTKVSESMKTARNVQLEIEYLINRLENKKGV